MRLRERIHRPKLSYANVVSTLALIFALSGSAYAVTQLPRESVGTRQLKKGAVTPRKLSPQTLNVIKKYSPGPRIGRIGPAGPAGPQGATGPTGPAGPIHKPDPGPVYKGAFSTR